eukprot:scaffold42218_cov37-Prasinocladus_malaysianus.AAC.2
MRFHISSFAEKGKAALLTDPSSCLNLVSNLALSILQKQISVASSGLNIYRAVIGDNLDGPGKYEYGSP